MKKLLVTVSGKKYEVEVEILEDTDKSYSTAYRAPAPRVTETFTPVAPAARPKAASAPVTAAGADNKSLSSPINGVLIEVPVTAGQMVSEGDTLFVLEAMKMKTNIASPRDGTIKAVNVNAGDTVESGQELLTFA